MSEQFESTTVLPSTLDLTSALIECASVTPDDAGCQQHLAELLRAEGFAVHHLRFGAGPEQTDNLWATHGSGAPLLALVGHTDVVPPGPIEQWHSDPFLAEQRDGLLYGRGAADMKSGVAAATLALADYVRSNPQHRGTVALLMTSDEEGPARYGVKAVMEWLQQRAIHIDMALIGEPSSNTVLGDRIRVGRRGSMHVELRVIGVQGHVAYPEKAKNPIHLGAPLIDALARAQFDTGNAYFPPTSMQIYEVQAGAGANNVIPGSMLLKLNFRYGTASTAESLLAQIKSCADALELTIELSHRVASAPFLTTKPTLRAAVESAISEVLQLRTEPDTGGGTSDGRFIAPTGAEVVELGPVNDSIHKVNEHIAIADLDKLRAVYVQTITRALQEYPQ
jgi:succinyl-diaminopimelate desuccinylase